MHFHAETAKNGRKERKELLAHKSEIFCGLCEFTFAGFA
jgi:hypothetical protein